MALAVTAPSHMLCVKAARAAQISGNASSQTHAVLRPLALCKGLQWPVSVVADMQACKGCGSHRKSSSTDCRLESLVSRSFTLTRSGRADTKRRPCIVCEIGGQYEESFYDVEKHMLNCFTFKAIRTVLAQLQETNPPQYTYLYNFVVNNKPQDGKYFIQALLKDRQELGERVMVQRLHLFNSWAKKYSHEDMYKTMSEQNLELLRERLIQTVKFADSEDAEHSPSAE